MMMNDTPIGECLTVTGEVRYSRLNGEITMDESRLMWVRRQSLKKEGYLSHEIADEMEAYAKELGLSTERKLAPQKAPTSKMGVSGKVRPDMRNWQSGWSVDNAQGVRCRGVMMR